MDNIKSTQLEKIDVSTFKEGYYTLDGITAIISIFNNQLDIRLDPCDEEMKLYRRLEKKYSQYGIRLT